MITKVRSLRPFYVLAVIGTKKLQETILYGIKFSQYRISFSIRQLAKTQISFWKKTHSERKMRSCHFVEVKNKEMNRNIHIAGPRDKDKRDNRPKRLTVILTQTDELPNAWAKTDTLLHSVNELDFFEIRISVT